MAVQHPLQDFARPSCGLEGRFGPGGAFAAAPSGLNKSQRQPPNFESGTICSWPPRLKVAWTCQEQLTNGEPQRPTENHRDQWRPMQSNAKQWRATESNGEQRRTTESKKNRTQSLPLNADLEVSVFPGTMMRITWIFRIAHHA